MRRFFRCLPLLLIPLLLMGNLQILALEPAEVTTPEFCSPKEIVRAIVLLEDQPEMHPQEAGYKGEQQALARGRRSTRLAMEQAAPGIAIAEEFSVLLSGFSVDVAYEDLDDLKALPGVAGVSVARTYEAPVLSEGEVVNRVLSGPAQSDANGSGTLIAILDTGLNLSHEVFGVYPEVLGSTVFDQNDTVNTSVSGTCVSEKVPFAYDYAENDGDVTDHNGHGTHVAGIAAGYAPGSFSGEAPGAQLAIMKIFRDYSGTTSSDLYFKALEDAYLLGVDVISMSLGTPCGFTHDDSLEGEIFGNIYRRLQDAGIILCAAGGNSGSQAHHNTNLPGTVTSDYADYGTVASPGTYEGNISVAAASDSAEPAMISESSWGTTPDLTIAPTVSAPGQDIVSAAISGSDQYRPSSGTSMATPAIAGQLAAVLSGLKESAPALSRESRAQAAEAMLLSSAEILGADTVPLSVRSQGTGLSGSSLALGASAYLKEPLLELGDDPDETGVYEMTLTLESTSGCPMGRFTDVDMGAWYHDEVDYTVSAGLFKGTTHTTFSPHGILTRGQTVTVLHRLSGSPAPTGACAFTDVRKGSYYEKAIAWAQEAGVVMGITTTTFCPDDPVTRQQLVTMLHRYLGKPAGKEDLSGYKDGDQVEKYARAAMEWAVETGIITGYTDLTLRPQAGAERCQLAAILYRQLGGTTASTEYETFALITGDSAETAENGLILSTLTPRMLDCTAEFSCGDTITLTHGKSRTVTVTVTLSPEEKAYLRENFPSGTFVEGYVGFKNEHETIHATFLAFFGDWEEGPILEQYDFRDVAEAQDQLRLQGLTGDYRSLLPMNTDANMAYLYCGSPSSPWYGSSIAMLGDNPFDLGADYDEKHIALSPGLTEGGSTYATELLLRTFQLRNARSLTLTVTDTDTGEIYHRDSRTYLSKSTYSTLRNSWQYTGSFRWAPVDSSGAPLDHGTALTVTLSASLRGEPESTQWTFRCMVDAMAPEVSWSLDGSTLTVTARDESFLSCLCVSDKTGAILAQKGYSDIAPGGEHSLTVDISDLSGTLTIEAVDYATNVTTEKVAFG